jgi:hypothetical protein
MPTEREIDETIARCVSIMVCYHKVETDARARASMVTAVQVVAAWALEMNLGSDETAVRILGPVERELLIRYGHESGTRVTATFLRAFGPPTRQTIGRQFDA